MNSAFWKDKWRKGLIGFHQQEFNSRLIEFFPRLDLPVGSSVFVPLCGKSRDMLWIRERGHRVLGIELSRIAVRDFFSEAGLDPVLSMEPPFERWSVDGIEILLGDVFDLTAEHLTDVTGFYDRAALVALPPDMRVRYARHLIAILPASVSGLMIGEEYIESEMDGPPFSVREKEVRELFGDAFEIETVKREDILEQQPRFKARLTELVETTFVMRRG